MSTSAVMQKQLSTAARALKGVRQEAVRDLLWRISSLQAKMRSGGATSADFRSLATGLPAGTFTRDRCWVRQLRELDRAAGGLRNAIETLLSTRLGHDLLASAAHVAPHKLQLVSQDEVAAARSMRAA